MLIIANLERARAARSGDGDLDRETGTFTRPCGILPFFSQCLRICRLENVGGCPDR